MLGHLGHAIPLGLFVGRSDTRDAVQGVDIAAQHSGWADADNRPEPGGQLLISFQKATPEIGTGQPEGCPSRQGRARDVAKTAPANGSVDSICNNEEADKGPDENGSGGGDQAVLDGVKRLHRNFGLRRQRGARACEGKAQAVWVDLRMPELLWNGQCTSRVAVYIPRHCPSATAFPGARGELVLARGSCARARSRFLLGPKPLSLS